MKKNIVIGVLSVITVLSIGYGYYQKREADRCIILAEQLAAKAEQLKSEVDSQRMAVHYLTRARNEALQALEESKNRK